MNDININIFIEDLASNKPAPGGGSASALFGVLGCSLSSMVCALTVGKKNYENYQDEVSKIHSKILELKEQFEKLMQMDIDAFNKISDAYKLPSQTKKEQDIRHKKIQENLIPCTNVPFEIMKLSAKGIDLSNSLIGKTNKMAVSDIGCAVLGFKAALKGGWLNVLINLKAFDNKPQDIENEAINIFKEYTNKADEIYKTVEIEI